MMAGYSFTLHMAMHITLVLIVPALLLMMLPQKAGRRSFPVGLCWCAGIGAMAFWHIPAIFNAVASQPALHAVEQISLVCAGTLFWWPILAPVKNRRLKPVPQGIAYLVSACFACTVMGILITFSPSLLYPTAGGLKDQRIGGLLMWVPCCLIYLTAVMAMFARWYAEERGEEQWT